MKKFIWVLWPSFVVAGMASGALFAFIDPLQIDSNGEPLIENRMLAYSLGFFLLWLLAAGSSAFTCFLQRSAVDINRLCPLEPQERPPGCPKREQNPVCCD